MGIHLAQKRSYDDTIRGAETSSSKLHMAGAVMLLRCHIVFRAEITPLQIGKLSM